MEKNYRVVLTGGPCSGKSTIMRELSVRGFKTLPEIARIYFDRRKSEGMTMDDIKQTEGWKSDLLTLRQQYESNIENQVCILDRSLVDNVAYRRHYGDQVPDTLTNELEQKYDMVFVLDMLDYQQDDVREESEKEAHEIHQRIIDTYEGFGYDLNHVPVMSINDRVSYITQRINVPAIH